MKLQKRTCVRALTLVAVLSLLLAACAQAGPGVEAPASQSAATQAAEPLSEPKIDKLEIRLLESMPVQVQAVLSGQLPDTCSLISGWSVDQDGNIFHIALQMERQPNARCAPQPTPFEQTVPIDVNGLPAGDYSVEVDSLEQSFTLTADNILPSEGETGAGNQIQAEYNGVTFTFLKDLSEGFSASGIPPVSSSENVPPWEVHPAYTELTLAPFSDAAHTFQPQVRVYPVSEYEAMSPEAAQLIANLRQILAEKPASSDFIPVLPMFNASQMFRSQVAYVDFQGGSGVRFITQYSQSARPVNNQELFYTFQGLTSDGKYYVSAIFPVNLSFLAESPDLQSPVPEGGIPFSEDFNAYLAAVVGRINASEPEDFNPALEVLDDIIRSLAIKPAS